MTKFLPEWGSWCVVVCVWDWTRLGVCVCVCVQLQQYNLQRQFRCIMPGGIEQSTAPESLAIPTGWLANSRPGLQGLIKFTLQLGEHFV